MPYLSDRRLYLNADGTKVVEHDDPEAATLLVGEGGELDDAEAAKYGLGQKAETKQVAAAPANKQVTGAPATKAAQRNA